MRQPVDREEFDEAFVMVEAHNEGGSWHPGRALCQVVVTVLDVNDNAPRLDVPAAYQLRAPLPLGSLIATLNASDPDNGLNGTVRWGRGGWGKGGGWGCGLG